MTVKFSKWKFFRWILVITSPVPIAIFPFGVPCFSGRLLKRQKIFFKTKNSFCIFMVKALVLSKEVQKYFRQKYRISFLNDNFKKIPVEARLSPQLNQFYT
jgi:hypothetical protein